MKRKLLAMITATAMLLSTASFAFADEAIAPAAEDNAAVAETVDGDQAAPVEAAPVVETEAPAPEEALQEMAASTDKVGAVKAAGSDELFAASQEEPDYSDVGYGKTNMLTGKEELKWYENNYDNNASVLEEDKFGISSAVTCKTPGQLSIAIEASCSFNNADFYFGVFKDAACSQPVDGVCYITIRPETPEKPVVGYFRVPAAGTYYIGTYTHANYIGGVFVKEAAGFYYGSNRTLTAGVYAPVGIYKDGQTNTFTFTATKTGYIKVYTKEFNGKIKLADSNGKTLAGYKNVTKADPNVVYGVVKGKKYRIGTYASGTINEDVFDIAVANTAISEKSGSSKSKAVTLSKGTKKYGAIAAGSSTNDYYKFKLSSKKAVTIQMKGATNDTLKIAIYDKKGLIGTKSFTSTTGTLTLKSVGKWTSGTYYVRIYRGNASSSGWYSLLLSY